MFNREWSAPLDETRPPEDVREDLRLVLGPYHWDLLRHNDDESYGYRMIGPDNRRFSERGFKSNLESFGAMCRTIIREWPNLAFSRKYSERYMQGVA